MVRLQWLYRNAILRNRIEACLVDDGMRPDQFRRRVGQPLRERELLIPVGLEHLEKHQISADSKLFISWTPRLVQDETPEALHS
jgi:hypothetical protein